MDSEGNIYISDTVNNRIRFVNQSTGIITTICGGDVGGNSGDGGPATRAYLYGPTGVAVDTFMNVYIAGLTFQQPRYYLSSLLSSLTII